MIVPERLSERFGPQPVGKRNIFRQIEVRRGKPVEPDNVGDHSPEGGVGDISRLGEQAPEPPAAGIFQRAAAGSYRK